MQHLQNGSINEVTDGRLTVEGNAQWKVGLKPFVAAGEGEIRNRQAVVTGDVSKRLSGVDDDEPKLCLSSYRTYNFTDRKSYPQVVNRRQEKLVAIVLNERASQAIDELANGHPFAQHAGAQSGNVKASGRSRECVSQDVLVGGPTEVRCQNFLAGFGQ